MTKKFQFVGVLLAKREIRVSQGSTADRLQETGAATVGHTQFLFTSGISWTLLQENQSLVKYKRKYFSLCMYAKKNYVATLKCVFIHDRTFLIFSISQGACARTIEFTH